MKKRGIILSILVLMISQIYAQKSSVRVISFQTLAAEFQKHNDTLYLYNFWATWCSPCVEELPYFEKVNQEFKGQAVKIVLVSLDFKSKLNTRLIPFVQSKKISSQVVLLNEPNYNAWINKVDPNWGGSIPATLVVNSKKKTRKFFEKPFTLDELRILIKQQLL